MRGGSFAYGALRSYLRGMETTKDYILISGTRNSDPTYEAWKHLGVEGSNPSRPTTPILPTRHGNRQDLYRGHFHHETPILPTRHGNKTISITFLLVFGYSDPTYEAWKLTRSKLNCMSRLYSDPTYEAWKLRFDTIKGGE